jgi:hypothetical protein
VTLQRQIYAREFLPESSSSKSQCDGFQITVGRKKMPLRGRHYAQRQESVREKV